jgi:hypothetical protein
MTILFGRTQSAIETPFEPLRNPGYGPAPSVLTSQETQNAIEEVYFRLSTQNQSEIRLVILNLYNSTWSNNSFLGRSELTPSTPIKFARNVVINELAFQNQNTAKNFFLDIYKNGQAAGDLLTTLTVNTGATGTGQIFQGLSLTFAAGDTLFYRYRSISGTSPSDSSIEIYCKVTS